MFRPTRQVLVLLACAAVLTGVIGQINHALAPFALTVSAPGLLVAFAALRLPLGPGFTTVFLTGLWLDATAPVAFGRQAALLALAFCLLHNAARRLPREETLVAVVAALFINLALFVVLAVLNLGSLPDTSAGGLRLLADLIISQLFTTLVGAWFLALQRQALGLAGALPPTVTSRFA